MNRIAIASLIAGVLTTGFVGLASPAQADIGTVEWVHQPGFGWVNTVSQPHVRVPHVDTTVHN